MVCEGDSWVWLTLRVWAVHFRAEWLAATRRGGRPRRLGGRPGSVVWAPAPVLGRGRWGRPLRLGRRRPNGCREGASSSVPISNHASGPTADPVTTDPTRIFMARIRRHRRDTVQSPLETYLREINEMALLTADEEKMLAHRIAQGDEAARDRMVRANLRLVVNIARGYVGKGLSLQDLIEEGNLGLLRAVEGFDPEVGTRFSTYASYWIKQSIKRALVNTAKPIRIPAYMVELLCKWRRAAAELQDTLGRAPTVEEIAGALEIPKKKLAIVKKAIKE